MPNFRPRQFGCDVSGCQSVRSPENELEAENEATTSLPRSCLTLSKNRGCSKSEAVKQVSGMKFHQFNCFRKLARSIVLSALSSAMSNSEFRLSTSCWERNPRRTTNPNTSNWVISSSLSIWQASTRDGRYCISLWRFNAEGAEGAEAVMLGGPTVAWLSS